MALRFYPAIISKNARSDFGVTFPDFPGCVSAGSTMDEVLAMGQEALAAHIAWMLRDGDSIPAPSSVEDAIATVDRKDRASVVTIQMMAGAIPGRAVRLNVTLEEDLIARIDADAGHYGRSKWLAEAARQRLGIGGASVIDLQAGKAAGNHRATKPVNRKNAVEATRRVAAKRR